MDLALLCGTMSQWFCEGLSRELKIEPLKLESRKFPDGESYVRLDGDVGGKDVILAQSLSPPQNDSIWELILLMEALGEARARRIILYIPYMAYSRQDKAFLQGEPISIKALLQILSFMGGSSLVTIDLHKEHSLMFFRGKAYNVLPIESLSEKILEKVRDPLIIAPDAGAMQRASAIAKRIGAPFAQLSKRRDLRTGEVKIQAEGIDVGGRRAVIVDDIISTGGTVAKAASILREAGAVEVYVAVSHALMAQNAMDKLKSAGVSGVIAANTLPPKPGIEYFDVTREAARALREALGLSP
ncbi:MAG: ribose-phosphate diphosphokinase [Fervidicoccaceae archaeon]|nr:MAG: hypothetical protein C0179_08055 [Fervidicoccus sp.]